MVKTNREPLVSVILACRDHGAYVRRAIQSCIEQTRIPDEFILIDDGSQDSSREEIRQAQRDCAELNIPSMRIRHPEPKGHIASYNEALAMARYPYVHLMAADDELLDSAFYEMALSLFRPDVGFVTCEVRHIDAEGKFLPGFSRVPWDGCWVPPFRGLELMLEHGNFICGGGTIVRKSLYKPYDEEFPYTADWLQWIKLFTRGAALGVIRGNQMSAMYGYRQHGGSMSSKTRGSQEERAACLDAIRQGLVQLGGASSKFGGLASSIPAQAIESPASGS